MADYSLVPVDYQPEFPGLSLIPVDYDPFADDTIRPAQNQHAQTQPAEPQPPAPGIGLPGVVAPATGAQASGAGESWSPDAKNRNISQPDPSTVSPPPSNNVPFKPFGELKPATFTPTQQIGNLAADAATALGMQPYVANDLARRIGNILGWTPLGAAGSALDFADATHRGDLPRGRHGGGWNVPGREGRHARHCRRDRRRA